MQEPKPVGRPSIYTDAIAQEICDTISTSNQSLQVLCLKNPHWPSFNAIYEWQRDNRENFGEKYAKAKEAQADYLAESILTIIDKPETFIDETGQERNDVGMMRLKVDSLKWQAMKLKPKKYGKQEEQEQSPEQTLSKIQALVADLNKTNVSDI